MPVISLPLLKGSRTTKNARYLDAIPVNLIAIPRDAKGSNYYLHSFPGIESHYQGDGVSYSGQYNDLTKHEYRVLGNALYESGVKVVDLVNPALANMCHSDLSMCFVANNTLNYWRDGKLTQIKNWEEGENYISYPDYKFITEFKLESQVEIPEFVPKGSFYISAYMNTKKISPPSTIISGSGKPADSNKLCKFELYLDSSDNKIYESKIIDGVGSRREVADYEYDGYTLNALLDNSVEVDGETFYIPISYIGSGDGVAGGVFGRIEYLRLTSVSGGSPNQSYSFIKEVERKTDEMPETPTDKQIPNLNDDTQFATLSDDMKWVDYGEQGDPFKSPATEFDIDNVVDVDRHEKRYVWVNKDQLGCTSLTVGENGNPDTSPEQRPDYVAPFYAVESDPDENKAVRSWQGKYIAVFGRNTTQFFALTGNAESIYAPVKNLQCPAGIVATPSVCHYMDAFAAIGSIKGGTLQVILIKPGGYQKISNAAIEIELGKYKESELSEALVESFNLDNHQFLMVHLPNNTWLYDSSTGLWTELATGYNKLSNYQGRHVLYDQELGLTIGSKANGNVGKLSYDVASQYGEIQEFIAYTPFTEVSQGYGTTPLYDLSFESIYGHVNNIQTAFISVTFDGRVYSDEELRIQYNSPNEYLNKIMINSLGAVQHAIGFKIRSQSTESVNWSDFSVRT